MELNTAETLLNSRDRSIVTNERLLVSGDIVVFFRFYYLQTILAFVRNRNSRNICKIGCFFQILYEEVAIMAQVRMRTILDALAVLKSIDKDTAITYNFIKKACETGTIKHVKVGKKILINLDELLKLLDMEEQ